MNLSDLKTQYESGKLSKNAYIESMYAQHCLLFNYSDFIKNTNISKIEISDDHVIATFRDSDIKFICVKGDTRLAPWDTINFSQYEKDELAIQFNLIKPTDTVIDIGANLGWYSMHLSKRFPQSKIFAFEPIPNTFHFLNANIQLNGLTNITTIPSGISNQAGEFKIYYNPELSVNASLANVTESPTINTITCAVTTLDQITKQHNIKKIDFIKCDIEGAELFALQGAASILHNNQPIVFCEMLRKWSAKFNYHPNDIIKYMSDLNYNCYVISGANLKAIHEVTENTIETNFIFLHVRNHQNEISKFQSTTI